MKRTLFAPEHEMFRGGVRAFVESELARAGITGPGFMVQSEMVAACVQARGSEAPKKRWLPRMVTGEALLAPTASDRGGLQRYLSAGAATLSNCVRTWFAAQAIWPRISVSALWPSPLRIDEQISLIFPRIGGHAGSAGHALLGLLGREIPEG